jgi:tRNA threonylcarbamoyladenosine biosynthesis protein TsaE
MPILDDHSLDFISRSPEQTKRIGIRLGGALRNGDLICLEGELGAGKTTLIQGMAQGWGALDPVSSPTFVLVNVYRRAGSGQFFHMDAYRVESASEGEELDLETMLSQGTLLIEWADRIRGILPEEHLWVKLEHVSEEHRQLHFAARGRHYDDLVAKLRKSMFGVD